MFLTCTACSSSSSPQIRLSAPACPGVQREDHSMFTVIRQSEGCAKQNKQNVMHHRAESSCKSPHMLTWRGTCLLPVYRQAKALQRVRLRQHSSAHLQGLSMPAPGVRMLLDSTPAQLHHCHPACYEDCYLAITLHTNFVCVLCSLIRLLMEGRRLIMSWLKPSGSSHLSGPTPG